MRLMRAGPAKHALLVEMLREEAGPWSPTTLRALIDDGVFPRQFVDRAARFIADKPDLWTVSDDEFIGAVREIDPRCAVLLEGTAGLAFLHRMSVEIAACRVTQVVAGLFGRG
jgi:hypothetical protein